jgi:type IV secretion/conjugal transfer VirB4 family ATPase
MIPLARIFKDYRDAESVAGLLDVWGFVDDNAFITKSGAVGVALSVRGIDYECLDHAQRRQVVHRFEAATRVLDEHTRLYQYLLKRRASEIPAADHPQPVVHDAIQRRRAYLESKQDDLYRLDVYFVLLYEGWRAERTNSMQLQRLFTTPRETLRTWFSSARSATFLSAELDSALKRLHDRCDTFVEQLADTLAPRLLDKRATFQFLRQLLNYASSKATSGALKYDDHLDFYIADSSVACHRAHLEVDDYHVKVLTLKEPPAQTFANVLEGLYTIPSEFVACSEWRRIDNSSMRRNIRARRRHFHQSKTSMVNYIYSDTRPEEMLVDDSAAATVSQLGGALTELEVNSHFFGEYSFTLVLFDRAAERLRRSVASAIKVFGEHDGTLYEESYNVLNAWLAAIPGNRAYNLRRLPILETNYGDLSFLFTLDTGNEKSAHLDTEYLAVFETRHKTPYFFNLHYQDVGHTLILGATGAGKSFLTNFLLTHAQKYQPVTLVFDLGGGYRKLTRLLGGAYLPIGLSGSGCVINPFSLDPTPENLHFLAAFVRVLVQSGGQYQTTMQDDRAIAEAVDAVYHVDRSLRRLCTVANLLPRGLSQYLARWFGGGPYASVFDNIDDTLTFSEWQSIDFEAMGEYPLVLEALIFYLLHRANRWIYDADAGARLKLVLIDEAWRFVLDDTIRRYIVEALKTWRKKNAALILATQSTEDFTQSALLRTVVESCATKLLLANPGMDVDAYRRLFHLNETEASLVADLIPRQQFLLKRPNVSKVLNLHVDRHSYWLYTHSPMDDERLNAMFARHGLAAGLDLLSQAQ